MSKQKSFIQAIAILIGTIVGAGIFGLPYAFSRAGILTGILWLVFLGFINLCINLFLGEICLRTSGQHFLSGFAQRYFGPKGLFLASLVNVTNLFGSLLAYLVIGGTFLANILNGFLGLPSEIYTLFFLILGGLGIILGNKTVRKVEFLMVGLLFLVVLILIIAGVPHMRLVNLPAFRLSEFFFPFGIVLFALWGASAVVEVVHTLDRAAPKIKKAIIIGSLVPILIYLIFGLLIVGVCGANVSRDAISALGQILGQPIVIIASLFGLLAVLTSFFVLGLNLQGTLQHDWKFNKYFATFLVLVLPLLLYLVGLRDFIGIISLLGVFLGGAEGILIIALLRQARLRGLKRVSYRTRIPRWLPYVIIGVFLIGFFLETYFFFIKG